MGSDPVYSIEITLLGEKIEIGLKEEIDDKKAGVVVLCNISEIKNSFLKSAFKLFHSGFGVVNEQEFKKRLDKLILSLSRKNLGKTGSRKNKTVYRVVKIIHFTK